MIEYLTNGKVRDKGYRVVLDFLSKEQTNLKPFMKYSNAVSCTKLKAFQQSIHLETHEVETTQLEEQTV